MSLLVDIEKKLGAFTLHAQFETSGGIMALLGASRQQQERHAQVHRRDHDTGPRPFRMRPSP